MMHPSYELGTQKRQWIGLGDSRLVRSTGVFAFGGRIADARTERRCYRTHETVGTHTGHADGIYKLVRTRPYGSTVARHVPTFGYTRERTRDMSTRRANGRHKRMNYLRNVKSDGVGCGRGRDTRIGVSVTTPSIRPTRSKRDAFPALSRPTRNRKSVHSGTGPEGVFEIRLNRLGPFWKPGNKSFVKRNFAIDRNHHSKVK